MAKDLTIVTAETIPSLPQRLATLASGLGTVQHPQQGIRFNLPTGWTMTDEDRAQAGILLATLTKALAGDAPFKIDGRVIDGEMAKGVLLTKMLRGLAGPAQESEIAADAKMGMLADAVGDLPAWAIDKAIRRWARGECPYSVEEHPRYSFPPSPATLRKLALFDMETARRDVLKLKNLLVAVPLERAMDPEPIPTDSGVVAFRRM